MDFNTIMKAAIREKYGGPESLTIRDLEIPQALDDEILVRIYATTVNRTDCGILRGKPFVFRFFIGLFRPRIKVTGCDFAGVVEQVGKKVKRFKKGDRVWGFNDEGLGSQAEYACFKAKGAVIKIPEGIAFADIVACGEGAHYALNCLNKVKISVESKVLVNGATGAIGSAAVQLLKIEGARVTAVANTENLDLVKSLGADELVDYRKTDFTQTDEKYHFIFDAVGKSSFGKCKNLLKPGGIYISSELGPGAENLYLPLFTLFAKRKVIFPIPKNRKRSISLLSEWVASGKFKPIIDRKYPLEKISDAYRYVESGKKTGNVILEINKARVD